VNNVGDNFGDAKSLELGYFPEMQQLYVYCLEREDKNKFAQQCFPAKMQASSLKLLRTSFPLMQVSAKTDSALIVLPQESSAKDGQTLKYYDPLKMFFICCFYVE
jgi:hypothetical protein